MPQSDDRTKLIRPERKRELIYETASRHYVWMN
jgi:hypothetical protein